MKHHRVGSASPTTPRQEHGNGRKVSQRGLLSLAMMILCVGGFGSAALGGAKIVFDILGEGTKADFVVIIAQLIVVSLAYSVGWLTAMVAIRVYGNLVLPILIDLFTWGCLLGICSLYILIMQRMYSQPEDTLKFFKYIFVMAGGLVALVGFHLIVEGHSLRPFSIPLLVINLIQLGVIVIRYVFDTSDVQPGFLWKDLVFFFMMTIVSISMLAHWGILEPLRMRITSYFDRNSVAIRTED